MQCNRYFGNCPSDGWLKRGEECVAEFFGANKNAELFKFKNNPDCVVMLLSKQGKSTKCFCRAAYFVLTECLLKSYASLRHIVC
jgi:hypothetical protein